MSSFLSPVSTNYIVGHLLAADLRIKLQIGANDARSDDTGRLKVAIAEWLNSHASKKRHHNSSRDGDHSETDNSDCNTPHLSSKGKEERGISNDITGRLICPIDYDWDDPE
jgi:hypothetical protein